VGVSFLALGLVDGTPVIAVPVRAWLPTSRGHLGSLSTCRRLPRIGKLVPRQNQITSSHSTPSLRHAGSREPIGS